MAKSVELLCPHCHQRTTMFVTENNPRITKGLSGGLPYTRVRTDCSHCGKEFKVPQTPETQELLKDKLREASEKTYPSLYKE